MAKKSRASRKRLNGFITRKGAADKRFDVKMRDIRTFLTNSAKNVRKRPNHTVPPTVILSMRSVGWPTPTGTL